MASRLILIDGYNLILRTPQLRPAPGESIRASREKLLNLLAWAIGGDEARFLVVFDGADGPSHERSQGRVEVRFTKPPQKADDLIRTIVEDQVERVDRLTVVTADLEVARHARAMGADVALSDLFLASVLGPRPAAPGEKPGTLSKKEVEDWAEIFRTRSAKPPDQDDKDEDDEA